MIQVKAGSFKPVKRHLKADDSGETFVVVRRATLADEGARYERLFGNRESAMITDIATAEIWLTLQECNIVDEEGAPVLKAGASYEDFLAGLTAIWEYNPHIFWEIHEIVREVNPQWAPDPEGNA